MDEKFLSFTDLTRRYGCSRTTIYDRLKTGVLPPSVQIGKSRRWKLSDLERFENE